MRILKGFSFLCLIAAVGCGGCGYSTHSALPANFRTISVAPFKNKIDYTNENRRNVYFPLMEVNARNAIVKRITFDGNLRIVDPDQADLLLKGDVVGYERQPIRYDENENVLEYRVNVIVDLVLWHNGENRLVWEEKGFVGEAEYLPTGVGATSEADAVNKALEDLGQRVVERIVEDW
jgi:hypothetical protein